MTSISEKIAQEHKDQGVLLTPLNDPILGDGFMRVTTALPDDNARFVNVLKELLGP
jgi:histidinol-phosphate aminotransferase